MPDERTAPSIPPSAAARAIAYLAELQPDLVGAAIVDSRGTVVAATEGEPGEWQAPVDRLLAAADEGEAGKAVELHIADPGGEVFAVREAGAALIAIAERFVLASLLAFDMRTVLRGMVADRGGSAAGESGPAADARGVGAEQ